MTSGRLILEWLLIGLCASLAVLWAAESRLLERRVLYDPISTAYAPPADDRILLVTIDDASLAALGRWPWPRKLHAQALDAMRAAAPRAIIYDVLFLEPTADDGALAAALKGGPPVFLPVLFDIPGPNGAPYAIERPVPRIAAAAAAIGTANLSIDSDGRTRSIAIATPDATPKAGAGSETPLSHLTELAYRTATGHPSPAFVRTRSSGDPLHIAFRAPGEFRSVSLIRLMRGEVPAAFLRDKLLIVGATAEGLGDLHPVPSGFGARMAGAEIQANLLSSLLADRFIRVAPLPWVMLLSLLPLWGLLIAFWRLPPSRNLLLSIGTTLAIVFGSVGALALGGLWFPPVPALLGIAIVYPLWGWRRLAAVTQYMEQEIGRLLRQTGLDGMLTEPPAGLDEASARAAGDRVAADASRLHQVINHMRQSAAEREQTLQFLSHDMRAPQAAIITLLDRAESLRSTPTQPDEAGLRARIRRHAESTLHLADDFVQIARLDRHHSQREPVDIADAMSQAVDLVWGRAQAKHVTLLRPPLEDEPLWVEGDPAALVRAFTNLLSNAVKASPDGGTVRCRVARADDRVLASVEDEGAGLPPERRADPFARFGYSSAGGDDLGSGLGLAYVAAVARFHRGEARYADKEGGGARFTLALPLLDDAGAVSPGPA